MPLPCRLAHDGLSEGPATGFLSNVKADIRDVGRNLACRADFYALGRCALSVTVRRNRVRASRRTNKDPAT